LLGDVAEVAEEIIRWILRLMTWLGSGGEVYIGAEGLRDGRYCTVIDEEKEKLRPHKTWYSSLYDKLFGGTHQK
jgi:hypothetical protein